MIYLVLLALIAFYLLNGAVGLAVWTALGMVAGLVFDVARMCRENV